MRTRKTPSAPTPRPRRTWTYLDKASGYRYVAIDGVRIGEHRWVMEQHLGRPLWPDEQVHHRNGDRADNRLTNLELWSTHQPPGQRAVDKLVYAQEIFERYAPDRLTEVEPISREERKAALLRLRRIMEAVT